MALIKADHESVDKSDNRDFRMEAYDVAHLSGTNVVGGMVVSVDSERAPAEYRKFKITKQANNDTAALTEILLRRLNHTEWTYPDLIVVDGNEVQMKVAQSVLKSRRLNIPIVAVTKNEKHKADRLIGDDTLIAKYKNSIIAINAEAHRFTIAFHRNRRRLLK
jgi:excinuclease ABC subunit C